MKHKELLALTKEAGKSIKSETDLTALRQMLTSACPKCEAFGAGTSSARTRESKTEGFWEVFLLHRRKTVGVKVPGRHFWDRH